MLKKFIPVLVLLLSSLLAKAQLPCNAVAFSHSQVGNTVTFVSTVPAGFQAVSYSWNFGDGGTSNIANPVHTYSNFGTYSACLVVSGYYGNNQLYNCTFCDSIFIPNNAPCSADFTFTTSGLTATFTNNATGPGVITNYAWNFGDGNQSNLPNPVHTYANNGTYNCCLTIYGIDNGLTYTCTWCDSVTVNAQPGPCNGVSFNTSQVGNAVTFNAVVPVGYIINTYYWTFGDGGTSNVANPTHTYANNGSYNACMVISGTAPNNVIFQCTFCDTINIPNNAPCSATFISTVSGNTVAFTNTATGPGVITGYSWTFGDGGTSLLPNPTHTYANNGSYSVCLTITGIANNIAYTCTWCDSVTVGINIQPCSATFTFTTSGATATFTNTATGPGVITNYAWNFGDGNNSNLPNPIHTYATTGWYNVCLTIYGNNNGALYTCQWCDSVYVIVQPAPCNGVAFNVSQVGNNATFSAVVPVGYVINTYFWTFGDGGNSNLANPTHTYANNGVYNVCMTISGYTANNVIFQCTVCDSIAVPNNIPCSATFISTVSGNTVAFTNTATGPGVITGYSWTFGDGGTSLLPNPTHTYANNGSYNVCLTITGIDNNIPYTCTWCDSVLVGVNINPCNSIFYTAAQVGNSVTFSASVPLGFVPNTYNWTFGDGGTSNLASPTHLYANSGWYNVCLVISGVYQNNFITCTYCDSLYVGNNNQPCSATFTFTTSGATATFTNTATGPGMITNYAWNFGDGNNSNLPNPIHTYATTGWYNVCLTIYGINNGANYTCTWCDSVYVVVQGGNPCNGFMFNTSQAGNMATFTPVIPAGFVVSTYSWAFGDGGTSAIANPTHTYASSGLYNVCLVITGTFNNAFAQCSYCDSIIVSASGVNDFNSNSSFNVYPNPSSNYIEIPLFGKNNYNLKLYDVAGKIIKESKIMNTSDKYILNTESLSKGMYFIQLISDNKKYHSNFIKQ